MQTATSFIAGLALTGCGAVFCATTWAQSAPNPQVPSGYQPVVQPPGPGKQPPYPQSQTYPQPRPYPQPPDFQPPRQVLDADVPPRLVMRPRVGLIIGGSITLGTAWILSGLVSTLIATDRSYSNNGNADYSQCWPLLVPVLGPWIQIGYTGNDVAAGFINAGLVFDGLVQAGGLAMLIAGVVTRTQVAVYAKNGLQLTPLTLNGGSGLLVSGRF